MPEGNVRPLRGIGKSNPIFGRRWKTRWAATLQIAAAQTACTVVDVSVAGARLRTDQSGGRGDPVFLIVGNNSAISARIAWCLDGSVGLCFIEEQPWVLDLIPFAECYRPSCTPNHCS
jgi:hypothetical protein